MNKFILLFVIAILSFSVHAQPITDSTTDVIVQQKMADFMGENYIPGVAVELYVDGKPRSYYFGYANQEKKILITKDTIFEVGSISKVMTSLLLAQQIDAAKMQLNDPIVKYIPDLPAIFDDISLQNLATHTSGLPFNVPDTLKTRSELVNYLTDLSLDDAPEDQWTYSNLGIRLLGFALEAATHKNINLLYRNGILKPLGMQPIGLIIPAKLKKYYAQGYDKEGNPTIPLGLKSTPAGGVKASAQDMQRFLAAAIGLPGTPPRIFYPMRMTQAAYVALPDGLQGLGWQVHSLTAEDIAHLLDAPERIDLGPMNVDKVYQKPIFDGNTLIDKTGATNGFRTYIAFIPNKKSGIVILTNKYVSNAAIVKTGREILFKLARINMNIESGKNEL